MTEAIIQTVSAHGYRRFLGWADQGDGHINAVHVAHFEMPNGRRVDAYAKLYPFDGGSNRGLVNEVTGYLIARAMGITQPASAFIAQIPIKKISQPKHAWLRQARKLTDTYPAFCTERLDGKSAAYRVPDIDLPIVIDDVRQWKELPHAVAMDENIAHTDRHLNNLIRLGRRRYAIIDNGILASPPGAQHWTLDDLKPHAMFNNRLSSVAYKDTPDTKATDIILDRGKHHALWIDHALPELDLWWSRLLTHDEHQAFRVFIISRTNDIEMILRKRFNRLL